MNREQAQEILHLYRPELDADEADFAEALELARRDDDLGQWLDAHCANYRTIRDRLKQIAVPAGLKEQILAEKKSQMTIVPIPRASWQKPLLAIAAVGILLLCLSAFWIQRRDRNQPLDFRNRMVSTALRGYGMDLKTNDLAEIRSFLAEKKAPSDFTLSPRLQKLESTGCVVLRWKDNPVSMICFRTGRPLAPGEQSDLFLFVTDRASFSTGSLNLRRVNKLLTASWSDGGKAYLLATDGDVEFLRRFL